MVQVSGGQLITSTGQPIMVQAVPGGQGQTIMQVPVSGTQGLQQVSSIKKKKMFRQNIRTEILKNSLSQTVWQLILHLIASCPLFAFSWYSTFVVPVI